MFRIDNKGTLRINLIGDELTIVELAQMLALGSVGVFIGWGLVVGSYFAMGGY